MERAGRAGHDGGVEGAGHGDQAPGQALRLEGRKRAADGRCRAGDDRLVGCVVVGDDDAVDGCIRKRRSQPVDRGADGRHRPGLVAGSIEDCRRPGLAQRDQVLLGDHTGRRQRDELTIAVATDEIGPYPERAEKGPDRASGDAHRGLRHPGVGKGLALGGRLLGTERGGGKHGSGVGCCVAAQQTLERREGQEEVGQHARPLAALPGEEERNLSGTLRGRRMGLGTPGRRVRARRGVVCDEDAAPGVGPQLPGGHELLGQVVQILRDQRDPHRSLRGRRLHRGRARQLPQPPRPPGRVVLGEQPGECFDGLDRGLTVGAAEAEQLGRPLLEPVRRLGGPVVAAQHGVEVGSPEPERAHSRVPLPRRHRPRAGLLVEEERARLGVPELVRLPELQRRRPVLPPQERMALERRARLLAWGGNAWHVVEFGIAVREPSRLMLNAVKLGAVVPGVVAVAFPRLAT